MICVSFLFYGSDTLTIRKGDRDIGRGIGNADLEADGRIMWTDKINNEQVLKKSRKREYYTVL